MSEDDSLTLNPRGMTFEQAATVPIAGITALQALRDKGKIQRGQSVLINGASGGVGTFAVQIAKSFGADVTGVCSTRNVQMVHSIGADHVIDYTREDFTQSPQRYDLIVDTVGNHSLSQLRHALSATGTVVIVGGASDGKWIEPLPRLIKAKLYSMFVRQKFSFFIADVTQEDLKVLRELLQSGKLTPVIDRRYPLREVPDAIAYLEKGHARGKVVIDLEENRSGASQ